MEQYEATDLARWGLLAAVRREAARDRLMAGVPEPSEAVLAALRQQSDADPRLLARQWRWQQWCEQQGAARLNSHFLARKAGLDQVSFWQLRTRDADLASELVLRLRENECSFEQLAAEARQGDQDWQVSFTPLRALEQIPPELAALLRVSEPGVVWAPRPDAAGGWLVLRLEQRVPAVLDASLRAHLLQELGEQALMQQLQTEATA